MEGNYKYIVRRITPIEGERLQGFADNLTRPCFTEEMITDALVDQFVEIHAHWAEINGKQDARRKSREQVRKWLMTISSADCPDGPRYKCIGNSMSVNVMQWIGQRVEIADRSARRDRGSVSASRSRIGQRVEIAECDVVQRADGKHDGAGRL